VPPWGEKLVSVILLSTETENFATILGFVTFAKKKGKGVGRRLYKRAQDFGGPQEKMSIWGGRKRESAEKGGKLFAHLGGI